MAVITPPVPGSPAARAFARQRLWGYVLSVLPALWLVAAIAVPGFYGRVAGHFALQAGLALLPGLLMLSRARSWGAGPLLVLLVVALSPWWRAAFAEHAPDLPGNHREKDQQTMPPVVPALLRLVQANIFEFNHDRAAAVDAIAEADPDIVSLLEATPTTSESLLTDKRWPYHEWWGDNCGIGLISRYPLEKPAEHLDPDGGWAWGLSATVQMAGKPLTVIVLHLASPVSPERQLQHDEEIRELDDWLARNSGPVVVMGDFNLTIGDREWPQFTANAGLLGPEHEPATWPSWLGPAGIGIDHILVRGLALSPPRPLELPGSDHRGLVATVGWP
jgi:endonuclease/exonuclease/phosphatase (EEP) superfamily protein YafD